MKQIVTMILIAAGLLAHGQKGVPNDFTGNFSQHNLKVEWVKDYDCRIPMEKVVENLKMSGLVAQPQTGEGTVYGALAPLMIDYRKAGATAMGVKPYISQMKYTGQVIIRKTEFGYTVTFKKIVTEMDTDMVFMGAHTKGMTYNFEDWAIDRNGNWKKTFMGKPAYTLDFAFGDLLTEVLDCE